MGSGTPVPTDLLLSWELSPELGLAKPREEVALRQGPEHPPASPLMAGGGGLDSREENLGPEAVLGMAGSG